MRKRQPLRSESRLKGRCEIGFWRPMGPDKWRIVRALERYQVEKKAPGDHYGPAGPYGVEVLKVLVGMTSAAGRCDPTLETIAKKAGCCIAAAVATLKRLKSLGFVNWIRRFVPARDVKAWGPQVHQTSNAYRVELPPEAAALVDEAAPPPADFDQRKADKAAQLRQYEADASGVSGALDKLQRTLFHR